MVPVFQPQNETELALASGALQAHEIPFFVHNGGFGGLYPGMQVGLYNVRTIMVPAGVYEQARDILNQFLVVDANVVDEGVETEPPKRKLMERFRLFVEILLGGWCVPRTEKRKSL